MTTSKPWDGLASIIVSASLLTGVGASGASEPVAVPPELSAGDLKLVFEEGVDPAKLDALVADTRKRSSEMRAQGVKDELAKDPAKVHMPWLSSWIIAALYQGDKAKEANTVIRNLRKGGATEDAGESDSSEKASKPKNAKTGVEKPLSPRAVAQEVERREMKGIPGGLGIKLLAMFGSNGKYPGRLDADLEAEIKENSWKYSCKFLDPDGGFQIGLSKYLDNNRKWDIFPLTWGHMWGTENQDIRYRPVIYLAMSILSKDPAYAGKSVGGKTVEEWFGLMRDCVKDYLKDRVLTGLWIEPGSHYAHINFDVMIDLYETAPDPEIRQRAKMFLDLALIEDEQISVNGLRGGAKSRTGAMFPDTSNFKDLVFGDKPGLLPSDYQAPAVAIALRHARGAVEPYHIYNRVPGENTTNKVGYVRNSRLVSYAYRTRGYLMGTALQDANLPYHPSSDQQRASSLIFQSNEGIYPNPKELPKKTDSGRSGKAFWSVQRDGAMVLQKLLKSDAVDRMEVVFTADLKITEREGWIFAEAGSGYAAVRFVDFREASGGGKFTWREIPPRWSDKGKPAKKIASPERDFLPIIIQAGDRAQYGSLEKFQKAVFAGKITINAKASEMEYQPMGGPVITWNYNQDANPLVLPRVDGKSPDLQPALLFDSPFLKAKWEDPKIYTGAGPFRAVYDMEKCTITETSNPK